MCILLMPILHSINTASACCHTPYQNQLSSCKIKMSIKSVIGGCYELDSF